MKAFARTTWVLLIVLLTLLGTPSAFGEQLPFCTGDGPAPIGQGFQQLAAVVGNQVGVPVECEHPEADTGDVQQHTSTGLLYWRKSTNTPTFTNGAEHWALRGTQSLHWLSQDADPPANAQVTVVVVPALPTPPAAPKPTLQPTVAAPTPAAATQPGNTAAAQGSGAGPGIVVAVIVVGLVLCAGAAALILRQRSGAVARGSARTDGLVAAAAATQPGTPPGTSMATPTTSGMANYVSTVPVQELQGAMHDIGRNRVTEQADAVLRYDPEPMLWEASPSVGAVLTPKALKWLVVVVVCVLIGNWLTGTVSGDSATLVKWGFYGLPFVLMVWSLGTTFARLRTTVYRGTRQRLEITSGVFGQQIIAHELHELGDAVIDRPLHYRIFGVGDVRITHRTNRLIVLEAIRNAQGVRDMLRSSGQIEAARFEKARWR